MRCIRLVGRSVLFGTLVAYLACGVASAALLSHFTFDSSLTDNQVAGRDGTGSSGASIDNSDFAVGGGSLRLDGGSTAEYVIAGTSAVPGIQGAYYEATVAMWFKADNALQPVGSNNLPYWGSRVFMGQANGDPATFGADNRMAFDLETDGNGKLRAFIRSADGTETNNRLRFSHDSTEAAEYLQWADGDWHLIAWCWEIGDAGVVGRKIWLDGAPLPVVTQENTLETDIVKAPLTPWQEPGMFIGANNQRSLQTPPGWPNSANATGWVNGWMDDLRVYDECLTDAQVAGLYAMRVPEPTCAILAAFGLAGVLVAARRRR